MFCRWAGLREMAYRQETDFTTKEQLVRDMSVEKDQILLYGSY